MDNYGYQPAEAENGKPFAIARYPSIAGNDCLVEVNSRSKMFKNNNFYKILTGFFALLAAILLILLIFFIVCYYQKSHTVQLCTSEDCLRSAANLRLSLNFSVDPCTDFYQYTCGRWTQEHPNHGWFPAFSTFSTISEHVLIATELFLTSNNEKKEPKSVRNARNLYKSCMNQDAINNLGLTAVVKYLKAANLPVVPSIFTLSSDEVADFKFDWLKADADIKKLFHMDVFIGFTVDANSYNRVENVMYIGSPGQECPLPSPLTKSEDKTKNRKLEKILEMLNVAKSNIVRFVLLLMVKNATGKDINDETLDLACETIINMTDYMNELINNHTVGESYGEPYTIRKYQNETNNYLISAIKEQYPDVYETYINHLFSGTNITIDFDKDLIYMAEEDATYLPKALAFILTTPDVHLELYMWWVTVYAMIINTSEVIIEFIFKELALFYNGPEVIRSQSLECSSLVNTFMGLAVSYGIADHTFGNQTKAKVEEMLYEIKDAFVEHVKSVSWMDLATKQATLEKSKEMISFIGYPDWLFNEGALDTYYGDIEMQNDTYLENMMSIVQQYIPSKLKMLKVANERNWSTDPTTVNAFNSFPDNAINVPMGILTFPVYNLGLEVLDYGAIGSVLGHELTHGFDNKGRKHDKFGNYKQWWTNETIETFEEKMECFIKQYDNFTISGIEKHVQGLQTLGENLADNGGLSHAFRAYQNHLKKSRTPSAKLPGFEDFSNNQLFFIAFASIWCETVTVDDLEDQISYDEHCPNSIRVVGTLQNSPDFAAAFKCPLGSVMNPKKEKCKVW